MQCVSVLCTVYVHVDVDVGVCVCGVWWCRCVLRCKGGVCCVHYICVHLPSPLSLHTRVANEDGDDDANVCT